MIRGLRTALPALALTSLLTSLLTLALTGCSTGDAGGDKAGASSHQAPAPASTAASATTTAPASPAAKASASPTAPVPQDLAFTAKTLDGNDFAGASLVGKPAVLWFWAPWCASCRADGPGVASTAQKVTIVGVPGLSDDQASMRKFVTDTRTGGFVHLGSGAANVWKRFGVTSQGTYVLIGSDGKVAYKGALDTAALARRVDALR